MPHPQKYDKKQRGLYMTDRYILRYEGIRVYERQRIVSDHSPDTLLVCKSCENTVTYKETKQGNTRLHCPNCDKYRGQPYAGRRDTKWKPYETPPLLLMIWEDLVYALAHATPKQSDLSRMMFAVTLSWMSRILGIDKITEEELNDIDKETGNDITSN